MLKNNFTTIMKTIIIQAEHKDKKLLSFISRLENFIDKTIQGAVVSQKFMSDENYNTILGEYKDATALDDFDVFIIAAVNNVNIDVFNTKNKPNLLICGVDSLEAAKNFIVTL